MPRRRTQLGSRADGHTVNLRPDPLGKRLIVELHRKTTPAHDAVVEHLCNELNQTETLYPGTNLTLVYQPLRSS